MGVCLDRTLMRCYLQIFLTFQNYQPWLEEVVLTRIVQMYVMPEGHIKWGFLNDVQLNGNDGVGEISHGVVK